MKHSIHDIFSRVFLVSENGGSQFGAINHIRKFSATWLIVALSLVVAHESFAANNRIVSINVASESTNEIVLDVEYNYSGDQGQNVFMSVVMANDGQPSSYFAFGPGSVQTGRHRTRVSLGASQSAPSIFSSNQLIAEMYVGGGKPFQKAAFNYSKTWTKPGASLTPLLTVTGVVKPALPTVHLPQLLDANNAGDKEITRRILPDGKIEIHYADGTVKTIFKGGYDVATPDGKTRSVRYASGQPPTPPSVPPDSLHAGWLEYESNHLLEIIKTLVGNDQASINNYLGKEGDNRSYYERISLRNTAIQRLISPL